MSEDFENKINQLKDLLSNKDNLPENLKSLINLLLSKQNQSTEDSKNNTNNRSQGSSPFDIETLQMFLKIKNAMDKINNSDDPREKLLLALKPYLKENRQDRLSNALRILKMTKLVDIINKLEDSGKNVQSW